MQDNIKKYIYDTLILFRGSSIAQIIPILAIPFIARLFGTEVFGKFAMIFAIATIIGSLASMRLEYALVPAGKKERQQLYILISVIAIPLVLLAIAGMTIVVTTQSISTFQFTAHQTLYLAIIAILSANINSANFYNTNLKNFKIISNAKIVLAVCTFILQIFLGYFLSTSVEILLLSRIISQLFSLLLLLRGIEWSGMSNYFHLPSLLKILPNYKQYYAYFWPASALEIIARQAPLLLIGGLYGDSYAGYFSMAERVLGVPTAAISSAVSQSFYQRFISELKNKANPRKIIYFTWKLLGGAGIIPFILLFLFSVQLVSMVLGSEWLFSAGIIRVLVPMSFFAFISSATSSGMIALNGQKFTLAFNIYSLLVKVGSLYFGYLMGDLIIGLTAMVILQTLQYIVYNITMLSLLRYQEKLF
ncbi:MAG: oligosaccharide flippase family protein [Candidatus Marinimicrobia bacterium]|nr:oligosaccharide flippase family protein [Candidatus Neomarinimicrobiota bacterium]